MTKSKFLLDIQKLTDEELVGKEIEILWQRKVHNPKVHNCGTEADMNHEADIIAEDIAAREVEEQLESRQLHDPIDQPRHTKVRSRSTLTANTSGACSTGSIESLTMQLQDKDREINQLRNKVSYLTKRLEDAEDLNHDLGMVEIGTNVFVKKAELETIKTLSGTITIFARNLFRIVFKNDELIGKSLFGKNCNANNGELKPSVDSAKRDAVILHTLKEFGISTAETNIKKSKVPFLADLKKSLGDFIREVNNKKVT